MKRMIKVLLLSVGLFVSVAAFAADINTAKAQGYAKLTTEAPVNGGRNYEENRSCKIRLIAGKPEYPTVLANRNCLSRQCVPRRHAWQ